MVIYGNSLLYCFFSLEDDSRALEDAKKALHLDNTNVKARRVCAESLFASGQFELGKCNYTYHNIAHVDYFYYC